MQNVKVYYLQNSNDAFVREVDADKAIADERAKVINEVEKMLGELQALAKLGSFELNGKELKYGISYTVEDMTERLKELKEQKNEV